MRQIFVILVFLPALICAKPLEDDEIFVDVEKITDHPDSSETRQGKKEEINEDEVRHDCMDCRKKLDKCLQFTACIMCPSWMKDQAIMDCGAEKYTEKYEIKIKNRIKLE